MYLIVDIGNTNQKAAFFDREGRIVNVLQKSLLLKEDLEKLTEQFEVEAALVSVVGKADEELLAWLPTQMRTLTFFNDLPLPIKVRYATPRSLGTDRLANAVGANSLFPNQNVLSIQVGSCLVTDLVTTDNEYWGGTIAPGLRMRFRALEHFTAKLPLIEPKDIDYVVGKSTEESILSGVVNGMACEIEGLVEQYKSRFPDLKIVITGGDAPLMEGYLKNSIFAAPNLVLLGLYKILRLNVSE